MAINFLFYFEKFLLVITLCRHLFEIVSSQMIGFAAVVHGDNYITRIAHLIRGMFRTQSSV